MNNGFTSIIFKITILIIATFTRLSGIRNKGEREMRYNIYVYIYYIYTSYVYLL